MLLEPVVSIRLVVEGCHLPVAGAPVHLDGFLQCAVGFEMKDRRSTARALYTSSPRLMVPDRVMRLSPAAEGEPVEVAVAV